MNINSNKYLITRSAVMIIAMLLMNSVKAQLFVQKTTNTEAVNYASIVISDINQDERMDYIYNAWNWDGNQTKSFTKILLNYGQSDLIQDSTQSLPGLWNASMAVADLDGDSIDDLIITGLNAGSDSFETKLYFNDGKGQFIQNTNSEFYTFRESQIMTGDIDMDGDIDLILSGQNDNLSKRFTEIYRNNGLGQFALDTTQQFIGNYLKEAQLVDLDKDEDMDLVMFGGSDEHSSILYLNDGEGNFSPVNSPIKGLKYGTLLVGDLDKDEDYDIIITGSNYEDEVARTIVYLNNGDATFTENKELSLQGVYDSSDDLVDIDADGDLDFIISGNDGASNYNVISKLYINDGEGNLIEDKNLSIVPLELGAIAHSDFDGDGDFDLIHAGRTESGKTLLIQYENYLEKLPRIHSNQVLTVSEAAKQKTAVGQLMFSAKSDNQNNELTNWTITYGNQEGIFSIDSTGIINIIDSTLLDFETKKKYIIAVTVDQGKYTSVVQPVTILLSDVNDNPPTIPAGQHFSVAENAANGLNIGTINATDIDKQTQFQNWQITSGNRDNIFDIHPTSGQLSITDRTALDYEQFQYVTLQLTVSDGVFTSNPQNISVNITDVNDNTPVIDEGQSFDVDENTEVGSVVGTVSATDEDSNPEFTSWTLSGSEHFTINQNGEILVNDPLDYEEETSYTLVLSVNDGTFTSEETHLTISVNNLNDNAPVIEAEQSFTIDEDVAEGTTIGQLQATDADGASSFSWSILSGDPEGLFTISSTGSLSLTPNARLDFETTEVHILEMSISDGVNTSQTEAITINVNDLNDNSPVIESGQQFSVEENLDNGTIIGKVQATDADANTDFMDWVIAGGNEENVFSIDSETGEILLISTLDFETISSYSLDITVSDGVFTSNPQNISVNITDVNDNTPVIDEGQSFDVDENTEVGSVVGTVSATDEDSNPEFTSWTLSGSEHFTINQNGEILVNDPLDYEEETSYTLVLSVNDGTFTSEETHLTISVNNLNDNAPVIEAEQSFTIDEDVAEGTTIGQLQATDADGASSFSWSILSGDPEGLFTISSTGSLSLTPNARLDFETTEVHILEMSISDGVNTSQTEAITINVNDLNDNSPVIESGQQFSVEENSPIGTIVGNVLATDEDANTSFTDWTIAGGNEENVFLIDSETGQLKIKNSENLDFESTTSYSLLIIVGDGENFSEWVLVKINILNVEEIILHNSSQASNELTLYPNPITNGRAILEINFDIESVQLVDLAGSTLPLDVVRISKRKLVLNVANVPAGIYLLMMQSGQETRYQKLRIIN